MLPELGHVALILALMAAGFSAALPLLSRLLRISLLSLAPALAVVQFMLITTAFAALINAYATSDFTVANVILNSHTDKPLLYKITGTWGNHEGSMLLWVWVLALYGTAVSFLKPQDRDLQQRTLVVQALLAAGFLIFIIWTSNPFSRVFPPPSNGNDLNPLLQDIGLALHPPLLYTGYVGFGIVFAYAIAGLWRGRIDAAWARAVQPWMFAAWTSLTLGIGMGSWWAYRELGWGGWWFWDPVENVSLLPWLVGTALLHSVLVLARRGAFARWVALLAILTFTMSLIGTFIVRSGLVMSVHAFTSDPLRGYAILGYIALVVGGALALFARASLERSHQPIELVSREGGILMNNLLLLTLAATILLAILTPLTLTLLGKPSITVGAPYFNRIFFPIAAPIVLLAGIAPLISWGRISKEQLSQVLTSLLTFAMAGALVAFMFFSRHLLFLMLGFAFSAWLVAATIWYGMKRYRAIPVIVGETTLKRLRRFPLMHAGTLAAHTGLAVLCVAITVSTLLKQKYEAPVPASGVLQFNAYTLTLLKAEKSHEYTYDARRATFRVSKNGREIATLAPEIRDYAIRSTQTSEVALDSNLWRDIYLVIGPAVSDDDKTTIGVRLYINPSMMILWLGFGLMAAGGAACFFSYMRKQEAA